MADGLVREQVGHLKELPALEPMSGPELRDGFLAQARPAFFPGKVCDWPALERWTWEALPELMPGQQIILSEVNGAECDRWKVSISDFSAYCNSDGTKGLASAPSGLPWYAVNFSPFREDLPPGGDWEMPDLISCRLGSLGHDRNWFLDRFGWLFMGPSGTRTLPHTDLFATHAWLAQIRGEKQIIIYDPAEIQRAIAEKCMMDFAWTVTLRPGDFLVIPGGVYHEATSLSPSMTLSFNFVDETNWDNFRAAIVADAQRWSTITRGVAISCNEELNHHD